MPTITGPPLDTQSSPLCARREQNIHQQDPCQLGVTYSWIIFVGLFVGQSTGLGLNTGSATTSYMTSGSLQAFWKPQYPHLKMETSMPTYQGP